MALGMSETKVRSLLKAVSYRVVSSAITGSLIFGATRKAGLATSIAGIEFIVKVFNFFLHERVWGLIPFGRTKLAADELSRR